MDKRTSDIYFTVLCILIFFERFFLIFFYSGFYDEFFSFIDNPYLLIGYVPIIFIILFILSGYVIKYKRVARKIVILLPILYLFLYPIAMSMVHNHFSYFDTNTWDKRVNIRSWMISDLKENYIFESMRKNEIIDLLGEPTHQTSDYFYYDVGVNFPNYEPFWIQFKGDIVIDIQW